MDAPERAGSGLVAKHGADFIKFNDSWSQIILKGTSKNPFFTNQSIVWKRRFLAIR